MVLLCCLSLQPVIPNIRRSDWADTTLPVWISSNLTTCLQHLVYALPVSFSDAVKARSRRCCVVQLRACKQGGSYANIDPDPQPPISIHLTLDVTLSEPTTNSTYYSRASAAPLSPRLLRKSHDPTFSCVLFWGAKQLVVLWRLEASWAVPSVFLHPPTSVDPQIVLTLEALSQYLPVYTLYTSLGSRHPRLLIETVLSY